MKKNIFINGCLALAAVSMMASCDDFLTEDPQSTYTTETFYTTESDFEYAVNALYQALNVVMDGPTSDPAAYSGGNAYGMFRWPSVRADEKSLYHSINFYDDGAASFKDGTQGATKDYIWQYMYIMITRANSILDRIDAFEFSDSSTKNELKGQTLALRGWAYHQLGIYFGGVPIITTETSVDETLKIGRSSQDETFAQAIKDYKAGMELLPNRYTGEDYGRIGKMATAAFLGRLYLFMGDTSNAATYLKQVIDSGLYSLADTYVDCFSEAGEGNGERVFELVYIPNVNGYGQGISESWVNEGYTRGDEDHIYAVRGSSHAMIVSGDYIAEFESGDARADEYKDGIVNTYGTDCPFCLKFSHYTETPTAGSYWGINIPLMRYADVILMYAECVGQAQGEQYLNAVRARAGLGAWTEYSSDWTTALRHERKMEFGFEGIRWFDLVRWGIAQTTMNAYHATQEGGANVTTGAVPNNMRAGQEVFAIPQTEIDLYNNTTLMPQNSAYE
jgi:tetratricopeptide (TPR) repeat protein